MEQLQFDDHYAGEGFDPVKQIDYTKTLDRRNARLNRADEAALAQVQRNNQVRIQNAQDSGNDLIALSKFSNKLTDLVGDIAKEREEQKKKEEWKNLQMRAVFGIDTGDYDKKVSVAKEQAHTAADTEAAVLGDNGENYEASSPIGNSTALSSVQKVKADSMLKLMSYPADINAVIDFNKFSDSSSLIDAWQDASYEWAKRNNILGLPDEFLADTILPKLIEEQQKAISAWSKLYAKNDSERRRDEAKAGLLADFDPTIFLNAVRNTVDQNGKTLGYGGAWTFLNESMTELRLAGLLTATDVEKMKSQKIPGDSKKRTYGELHKAKFGTIERQVSAEQRKIFRESEAERETEFKKAEEQLRQAFIDSTDTDGYTDDQIDDAINTLRDTYGFESQELAVLKKNTVDAKTRKVQEKQIENLLAMNLLTPETLKRFDPKLQNTYRSKAQEQANLRKENGDFQVQERAIRDMVEHPVSGVGGIVSNHLNVGLMVAKQKRRFHTILVSKALAGETDPVDSAFAQVKYEFENGGYFKENGDPLSGVLDAENPYAGVAPTFNPSSQQDNQQEIIRMNSLLKSYGKSVLDLEDNGMNPVLFSKPQIEAMKKGYGEEGWSPSPAVEYSADILDMDPLSLINKLRETNGMDALPATPAYEVIQNQLTPTQQRLLRQFKTPDRSARGLIGQTQYNPETVPKGYGKAIQDASSKYGVDPSIIAGLIETESAWNPNAVSSVGAKGLAQFIDPTAAEFGVNQFDAASSIDGAAKYLKYLMDYFNGDVRLAIFAYNGGMGNIERYGGPIPGSTENQEYYGKVIRSAGKYGYGKKALIDPGTMRSSIAQQL